MPAVTFGLGKPASKPNAAPFSLSRNPTSTTQKRKNLFADDEEIAADTYQREDESHLRPKKSPKLFPSATAGSNSTATPPSSKLNGNSERGVDAAASVTRDDASRTQNKSDTYKSLSSLRDAALQDAQASSVDNTIYDYDAAFDTFSSTTVSNRVKASGTASAPGEAKYMNSLLSSATTRKRDHLRAQEKKLQRDREKEGDEFAGTEKFVTSAYKKQQEENRKLEEDEAQREKDEEERRQKGIGMKEFHAKVLEREEERMKGIEENVKRKAEGKPPDNPGVAEGLDGDDDELEQKRTAAVLNEKGSNIVVNDEGEIVDKRQLLSAGLNVAKKPKPTVSSTDRPASTLNSQGSSDPSRRQAQSARESQRERQTRMLEQQIQRMEEETQKGEEEERKREEEKAQSMRTEEDKMSAKERYLARKREREEEAKNAGRGA